MKNERIDFNKEIYNFVVKYYKANMVVPTLRNIVIGTSYKSTSTVNKHMQRLVLTGHLNQVEGRYTLPKEKIKELLK